jgi:hypothetical protein
MDANHVQRLRADLAAFLDDLLYDRLGNVARRRWAEVYVLGAELYLPEECGSNRLEGAGVKTDIEFFLSSK